MRCATFSAPLYSTIRAIKLNGLITLVLKDSMFLQLSPIRKFFTIKSKLIKIHSVSSTLLNQTEIDDVSVTPFPTPISSLLPVHLLFILGLGYGI